MSQVIPAIKTMVAIDRAMRADQGAAFRQWQQKVLPHLDDAYRGEDEPFRGHLGASVLADECGRAIWYGFRWATRKAFSGQTLRLFNRGHLEEGRVIAMLLTIGVQIAQQDANGKQYRISFAAGHGGGSGDGFGCNIPDLSPDMWAQLEFKTHNKDSFEDLAGKNFRKWFDYHTGHSRTPASFEGKGVRYSKPEHYAQMQTYMRKFGLACALYVAVNKNTDDVYMEIVHADTAIADQFIDRAEKIIWMHEAPKRISESPGYFGCKWCDHLSVCKLGNNPDRNCRTCRFSEPRDSGKGDGQWWCKLHDRELPRAVQLVGCGQYETKPM
jgi:hypothetical protein